jgi:hypothetical protein
MSTKNSHITTRISKDGTEAGVRYSRGAREAIVTVVKVAGISMSNIKAEEEMDSPLVGHAGVVGFTVPTAGAAAAECVISSRKESDKSSRASGAGNQGFGVGRMVAAVGIRGGIIRVGAIKEAVVKGAHNAKMVEGGRKAKHILVNKRLNDGRVRRCEATTELLPLGKVTRASSGNRCKRCITLIRGRRRDSHINNSIVGRGRGWVAVLLVRVKLEADVGRAGVGEVAIRYLGSG